MVQDNTIYTIDKEKLKGKYIMFFDKQSKQRVQRVIKITGKTVTVQDAVGVRMRLHPDKQRIVGVYYRKKLVNIIW